MERIIIRKADLNDLNDILSIYNQGIEDRIATLEVESKSIEYMNEWFNHHEQRYTVLVAVFVGTVIGWASLNRYSPRAAYDGVADLSIYIERTYRGRGIGQRLLQELEVEAINKGFHTIVLFTFPFSKSIPNFHLGTFIRFALAEVSIAFRKSEFVKYLF